MTDDHTRRLIETIPATHRPLYEVARETGMSEREAFEFARGREDFTHPDPFEDLVGTFRGLGLSEAGARTAAVGRNSTEGETRQLLETAERARRRPPTEREICAAVLVEAGIPRADAVAAAERIVPGTPTTDRTMLRAFREVFESAGRSFAEATAAAIRFSGERVDRGITGTAGSTSDTTHVPPAGRASAPISETRPPSPGRRTIPLSET